LRFASAEELESDGFSGGYDDVGQKNGKWLVTKNGPGAADGVSETAWLGLQDIFHTNHSAKVIDLSREILLAAMTKESVERRIEGEIGFDERRSRADDENDGVDSTGGGFFDGVLD
jgi:hypothetical protein